MYTTLGPRSRNDLDLQYSHIFIFSIRCLLLLTFRSLATIYGRGSHLGHVTSIMSSDFISLYLKAFIQSLDQIGTVVSEKIQFEFLYVQHLGPRSRNDLDLQYSHIFIYSIRCLLLLTFRSLAAIVSEKSTVFTFSYRKN